MAIHAARTDAIATATRAARDLPELRAIDRNTARPRIEDRDSGEERRARPLFASLYHRGPTSSAFLREH